MSGVAVRNDNRGWRYVNGVQDVRDGETWQDEPPSSSVGIMDYQLALRAHLDTEAVRIGYDNAAECASWVTSTVALYAAEATAYVGWRDAAWQYALALLGQVEAGAVTPPTIEAFIAGVPPLVLGPEGGS